jgi:hypothetical protein
VLTPEEHEGMIEDLGGKKVTRAEMVDGGQTVWETPGLYEVADESIGMGIVAGMETVLITTGKLGELTEGVILSVEDVGEFLLQFDVRERDGALTRLAVIPHDGDD